jgi:hypothetical protein
LVFRGFILSFTRLAPLERFTLFVISREPLALPGAFCVPVVLSEPLCLLGFVPFEIFYTFTFFNKALTFYVSFFSKRFTLPRF